MVKNVDPKKPREPKTRAPSKKKAREEEARKNIELAAVPFLTGKSRGKKWNVFNSLITGDRSHAMAVFLFVLESPNNLCVGRAIMEAISVWVASNSDVAA